MTGRDSEVLFIEEEAKFLDEETFLRGVATATTVIVVVSTVGRLLTRDELSGTETNIVSSLSMYSMAFRRISTLARRWFGLLVVRCFSASKASFTWKKSFG